MSGEVGLDQLALVFLQASLLSIGGANAVLPELHRVLVESRGWMREADFIGLFALGQAAPGPNVITVVLFGQKLGGVVGGVLAIVAMCGPTCVATYWFYRVWDRFKATRWRQAVQAGLAPVTVGLVLSTGFVLALGTRLEPLTVAITLGSAATMLLTKLNPLWCLATGGLLTLVVG
jgi:chromate transporter